tara:strand:- start:4657 stop:5994 length:1338 start_codon:yes stop_codon:yes gene_type:complete
VGALSKRIEQNLAAADSSLNSIEEELRLQMVKDSLEMANSASKKLNAIIEKKGNNGEVIIPSNAIKNEEEFLSVTSNSLKQLVDLESDLNIYDDFQEYNTMRKEIEEINEAFDNNIPSGIYVDREGVPQKQSLIDNPDKIYYNDKNSLDKIWGTSMLNELNKDADIFLTEKGEVKFSNPMLSLENITKSRIISQNPAIRELVYGTNGFNELLDLNNLDAEGGIASGVKDALNISTNKTQILEEALHAKSKNKKWFIDGSDSDLYKKFLKELDNIKSEEAKEIIKINLQKQLDRIYEQGMTIYNDIDMFDRYNELQEKFPKYKGFNEDVKYIEEHGNEQLQTYINKRDEYRQNKTYYETVYDTSFNVNEALNQISIGYLNKELEKLPDEERTSNLDSLIIKLSDSIQSEDEEIERQYANYLESDPDDAMQLKWFKEMYKLDSNRWR